MIQAILATNFPDLNNYISKNFRDIFILSDDIQTQDEALDCVQSMKNADAILLTDMLRGSRGLCEFIETLAGVKEVNAKVYYLAKEYDKELIRTLNSLSIKFYKVGNIAIDEFISEVIKDFQSKDEVKTHIKEKVITVEKEKVIKEYIVNDKIVGTVFIGVAGTSGGIGSTHAAVSVAYYLSRLKSIKAAFIELDGKKNIRALDVSCPQALIEGSFSLDGIDFYCYGTSVTDLTALHYYNYIIMDFGCLKWNSAGNKTVVCEYYEEFVRADLSILVCGSQPWQIKDIGLCLYDDTAKTDYRDSIKWKLLFNFTDEGRYRSVSKNIEWQAYNYPYRPDVLSLDPSTDQLFSSILKDYIPHSKSFKTKSKGFLFLNKEK